ncbi:hypothetical protein Tco_0716193 [Tanacetum coccineum]
MASQNIDRNFERKGLISEVDDFDAEVWLLLGMARYNNVKEMPEQVGLIAVKKMQEEQEMSDQLTKEKTSVNSASNNAKYNTEEDWDIILGYTLSQM